MSFRDALALFFFLVSGRMSGRSRRVGGWCWRTRSRRGCGRARRRRGVRGLPRGGRGRRLRPTLVDPGRRGALFRSRRFRPHFRPHFRPWLDARRFVRIHRATIVHVAFVQEIFPGVDAGMFVRLKDEPKTELSVARDRVRVLKDRLGI